MKWIPEFLKRYIKLKKTPEKKSRRKKANGANKIMVDKTLVTSFGRVRKDVTQLQSDSKEITERLKLLERLAREHDSEIQKHIRWIQHHNEEIGVLKEGASSAVFRLEKVEGMAGDLSALQKEFADLVKSLPESPSLQVGNESRLDTAENLSRLPAGGKEPDKASAVLEKLTPYTRKALFLIVTMLRETGEAWLPLAQLTAELYPDHEGKKLHNVVANVLRPLYQHELLEKRRTGNYVRIRPTEIGLAACKEHLKDTKIKSAEQRIEDAFRGLESGGASERRAG